MRSHKTAQANPTEELHLLQAFIRDLAKYPLLTREQEAALVEQASAGDTKARNRLIEANLRWVVKAAFKLWRWAIVRYPGISIMDLIQAGCIGLITSIETLNPSHQCRVLTYARFGIEHRMLRDIDLYNRHMICISLDMPLGKDPDAGETFGDQIPAEAEDAEEAAFKENLADLVETLKPRQKAIVIAHYWGEKTLDQIGSSLKIGRARAAQVEKRALLWIRSQMEKNERREAPENEER